MDATAPTNPTFPDLPDLTESLLSRFGLTSEQKRAAREREHGVAVTAGAGSGKTRTLVARYLPLLADCRSPRRIAAITFTEKAAREMRNRVRAEVRRLVQDSTDGTGRKIWQELENRLDSARISTIHSLCQEVLRAHPVEAGLDPEFTVVDENQSAVLRVEAVRACLDSAVEDPSFRPLFALFKAATLEKILNQLVGERLDTDSLMEGAFDPNQAAARTFASWLRSSEVEGAVASLRAWKANCTLHAAERDGDKLGGFAVALLESLEQAAGCLSSNNTAGTAQALFTARRNMPGNVGRSGPIKELVKSLKADYDHHLSWLGGAKSTDLPPDLGLENKARDAFPLLARLYEQTRDTYLSALRRAAAVDFNDLEGMTCRLLQIPSVAARLQSEIDWVLVDEFQDTNTRQREIVNALCGEKPKKLFIVGDARQSIYRFRGADVTVFQGVQSEIESAGGQLINLAETFRAHEGLLAALDDLLGPIMDNPDLERGPFHVGYAPLKAVRAEPRSTACAPHVEFILSPGPDADGGRKASARTLARHLLALKDRGAIGSWDEVALLFRASTSFQVYEDALEEYAIPYITVAGRGFYDRPEVRDVLNLLAALSDPWDDMALAGLLSSPAFGLSPLGLSQLRLNGSEKRPLYQALQGDLSSLEEPDRLAAVRARDFLAELLPWVDRIPVAELLERAVAWTHYRAILASGSHRLWRNLDKLLEDAQSSGIVPVRAFLEYLTTLKEAGAREGEAAAEAEGAVRLMTIHKSKGLEFETVVLADAARQTNHQGSTCYLLPGSGLAFKPDRAEGEPVAYRYLKTLDRWQSDSEACRLLYVALTRAREKLIVCGHYTDNGEKQAVKGWMEELLAAAGLELQDALDGSDGHCCRTLPCGQPLDIWTAAADIPGHKRELQTTAAPEAPGLTPLFRPILLQEETPEAEEGELPTWRVTGQEQIILGRVVGKMVHKAIQRWRFPGDPVLPALLERTAREEGMVDEGDLHSALDESCRLLERFRAAPLWEVIDRAAERLHEVPYTLPNEPRMDVGYIDLLYRATPKSGWSIVDFKTDALHSSDDLNRLVARYTRQARRYTRAVRSLLGMPEAIHLCFLDAFGQVQDVTI